MIRIDDIFYVKRGKGDYRERLAPGRTSLISATNLNNGVIDHVEIEPTFNAPAITVERVSGQAFVQLTDFATVPDDMSVLVPKESMSLSKLFYVSAVINIHKWQFSYGRKLTPTRLKNLQIDISYCKEEDIKLSKLVPRKKKSKVGESVWKLALFSITDLFEIDRGDFHAIEQLDDGMIPTVSRVAENNGVVGYFEKPDKAQIYKKGILTISTVTGDAFVQLSDFMATDNVLICNPKRPLKITTLFFIQLMINKQRWRFSYGRQPYKRIFSTTRIFLPVDKLGNIDEDSIVRLVENRYGWDLVSGQLYDS